MNARAIQIRLLTMTLTAVFCSAIPADDATTELFHLLDKGDCTPASLTMETWEITSTPTGTHGELNWGDELLFEQLDEPFSMSRKSSFNVWRNGVLWDSTNGWRGSCVRDGNTSLYVVTGEIAIEGCMHELAIGRLEHDNNLGNRIEVVFQDQAGAAEGSCEEEALLHPGHAHGDGGW